MEARRGGTAGPEVLAQLTAMDRYDPPARGAALSKPLARRASPMGDLHNKIREGYRTLVLKNRRSKELSNENPPAFRPTGLVLIRYGEGLTIQICGNNTNLYLSRP